MTGAARRVAGPALALALGLLLLAPAIGVTEPPVARGAATDLTLVTDAMYTVQPGQGRVGVSMAVQVRNRTRETRTKRFYFDHAFLAVQPGATNIRLTGATGAKATVSRANAQATLLRLDFGARLWSGRSTSFRLTFDLPGRGSTASPQVRVGTSLVTVPVWAFASNGASGSTVAIRFPAGWDVNVESGTFSRRSTSENGTTLATGRLATPLTFFAYVSAERPATYVDQARAVPVGGGSVDLVLRAWEDDPGWATRTGDLFARALPVLAEHIGVPWPLDAPLVIEETASRDTGAYAGLFDATERRMQVAYWADHGVVIHQAAHGWFNGHLLADRWANEGFATYYGLQAAATLKEPAEAPALTDAARAAAQPLNAWSPGAGEATPADDYATWASLQLATAIDDAVGPDVLAQVWGDAADGTGAYQPPVLAPSAADPAGSTLPVEGVDGVPDWRGLLDLLEARSGQDLVGLWRQWVITPSQAGLLDRRAAAVRAYHETVAVAADWQLPRAVRDAMRAWQFDTATALMADARTVLAQRNAVRQAAADQGVTLPPDMRDLFEAGALADASARGEAELAAVRIIAAAAVERTPDDDLLSRIGMIGEHPERDVAAARDALAAGDIPGSAEAAARAHRAWTASAAEGRRRLLLGLAVLATVVILAGAAVANLRRSRGGPGASSGRAAGPDPDDPDDADATDDAGRPPVDGPAGSRRPRRARLRGGGPATA